MNELELIQRLTGTLPGGPEVRVGPGDDCAVLDLGMAERELLFKTDAVVEGVHFTADTPPEKIGRKALARCLSDVAAMAGTPTAALVTLGLPRDFRPERVEAIYAGLGALARQHGVAVGGGETTLNPGGVLLSVALLGWVARGRAVRRAGARAGDAIFVTGELGGALAGKHLDFEPRLVEARWLAERFDVHAMIDVSDGLAGDLRHLLRAGGVGAELLKRAIPISRAARERNRPAAEARQAETGLRSNAELSPDGTGSGDLGPALLAALTDGEDFELLFTVAAADAVRLLDAWKVRFPTLRLSCIGKVVVGHEAVVREGSRVWPLPERGYVHFA